MKSQKQFKSSARGIPFMPLTELMTPHLVKTSAMFRNKLSATTHVVPNRVLVSSIAARTLLYWLFILILHEPELTYRCFSPANIQASINCRPALVSGQPFANDIIGRLNTEAVREELLLKTDYAQWQSSFLCWSEFP